MVVNEKYPEIHVYVNTVHIGYSDNAEDIDLGEIITITNISLYPTHYVWVSWRRGFILRDNDITISNIYCMYLGSKSWCNPWSIHFLERNKAVGDATEAIRALEWRDLLVSKDQRPAPGGARVGTFR